MVNIPAVLTSEFLLSSPFLNFHNGKMLVPQSDQTHKRGHKSCTKTYCNKAKANGSVFCKDYNKTTIRPRFTEHQGDLKQMGAFRRLLKSTRSDLSVPLSTGAVQIVFATAAAP